MEANTGHGMGGQLQKAFSRRTATRGAPLSDEEPIEQLNKFSPTSRYQADLQGLASGLDPSPHADPVGRAGDTGRTGPGRCLQSLLPSFTPAKEVG